MTWLALQMAKHGLAGNNDTKGFKIAGRQSHASARADLDQQQNML